MKLAQIGSSQLHIKDYHCAGPDEVYLLKEDNKLWLYINLTNRCNARCPFCVNSSVNSECCEISIPLLQETLQKLKSNIRGISITGGEPMLFPNLVDEVARLVTEIWGYNIPLDLVTNGSMLQEVANLKWQDRFSVIHISRHCISDEANQALMGTVAPSAKELKSFISELDDPAKIVLNCVLQKHAVASLEDARLYLEMAAAAGVHNVSFVGMFIANDYCLEQYISPHTLRFETNPRFSIWNRFHDHTYCCCSSGDYSAQSGFIRFYYRCPGTDHAPYVRQLVYNHDNRLLDGFGGHEILV